MHIISGTNLAGTIHFKRIDSIPMLDWDWADVGHKSNESITIKCLKDVIDLLNDYIGKYPQTSVRVYVTPGGVRAFFIDERCSVEKFFNEKGGRTLNADPLYINLCKKGGNFPFRISPKPGRVGDFVASYVCTLGAPPNKKLVKALVKYHDEPIKQFRSSNSPKIVNYSW